VNSEKIIVHETGVKIDIEGWPGGFIQKKRGGEDGEENTFFIFYFIIYYRHILGLNRAGWVWKSAFTRQWRV
jgi:hypothetical protein